MSKTSLRLKLAKMLLKFATVTTDKGTLNMEGDLIVGIEVYIENEGGEMIPATDGEYVMEDGRIIVITDGKVAEIKEATVEEIVEDTMDEDTPAEEIVEEVVEEVATPNYEEILNTLVAAIEELTARVDALTTDVEELKKASVPTIDEEFSKKKPSKTDKKCWERI